MPERVLKYGEWKIFKLQQKPQSDPAGNKIFSHPSPNGPCEQNSAAKTFSSSAASAIDFICIYKLQFEYSYAKMDFTKYWDDAEKYYVQASGGRPKDFMLRMEPGVYACLMLLYQNKHVIHLPWICLTVKQLPGQSKANNSQNSSCIQVAVWETFMSQMFEVCWETRISHYSYVWALCLVGTVKAGEVIIRLSFVDKQINSFQWVWGEILLFLFHECIIYNYLKIHLKWKYKCIIMNLFSESKIFKAFR